MRRSNTPFDESSLWLVCIQRPIASAYQTTAQLVKSFSSVTLTASDDAATAFMSIINKYVWVHIAMRVSLPAKRC